MGRGMTEDQIKEDLLSAIQVIAEELREQTKLMAERNELIKRTSYFDVTRTPSRIITNNIEELRKAGFYDKKRMEEEKMDLNILVVNLNNELNNKYINSNNPFIKENSFLIVKYTDQLSKGQITQNQYEGYVVDIQRLAKLEELEQVVEKKAIYQGFMNMIQDIILNGIVAIMKAKNI